MADSSTRPRERYAEDMNNMGRWELTQRQHDVHWGLKYPEVPVAPHPFPVAEHPALTDDLAQLQLGRIPKTRTSPVATRTRVSRHGSNPHPVRPSSSGGENVMLSYRQLAPPRRAESYSHPTPLEEFRHARRWPPSGVRQDDALGPDDADKLICAGASTFKGYLTEIAHSPGYDHFYAVMNSAHQGRTDRGPFQHEAYRDVSIDMTGNSESQFPWQSLEQPCMAYAYGKSAGTTTMNHWVSKAGSGYPAVKPAGGMKPRKIKFLQILDRLRQLEDGLEVDVSPRTQFG